MTSVHIYEEFLPWMVAAGLNIFRDFSEKPIGMLLSREKRGREIRKISVERDGIRRDFYLKRMGREPIFKLARMLCWGHIPDCAPIRELRMLQALQRAGFATMRPVAFGTKRVLGWPVGAFLMVEGVAGVEVADLAKSADSAILEKLYFDLGA